MIWGIVYGALAVATLAVLALPGVRIVTQAKALSRAVAASSSRISSALADIERVSELAHDDDRDRGLVNRAPVVEDGAAGTYDPEGYGDFRRPRRRSRRGS
jgi:hypothetical protein